MRITLNVAAGRISSQLTIERFITAAHTDVTMTIDALLEIP